tara:strand:- start:22190 stop:22756 length:567 start_codon:yes stop_codon:yes gene_type:complete
MKKHALRKLIKEKRKVMSKQDIKTFSDSIMNHLIEAFEFKNKLVNVFLPIQKFNEIDLTPLKDKIETLGGKVCINRSNFDTFELSPILWDDHLIIEENQYGIPEPINGKQLNLKNIDIVLVPLLAFTSEGHRLGYGKGFYDRFLIKTADQCIHVGICHNSNYHQIDDINDRDIALEFLISPEGMKTFN